VITCAAPYLVKRRYVNPTALGKLFEARIRNILEAAMENGAEVLILGAFGCGAFGNPPDVVARAFREVLSEQRYQAFRKIVFAIKSSVGGDPYTVCPNLAAFQTVFCGSSSELEKLRYVGGAQDAPGMLDVVLPGGRIRYRGSESRAYYAWREKNPYFGKKFSVLGDSISTLEGFNPRNHPVFYDAASREKTGVWEMGETWWGKVIGFFGGELLVNDSWSGGRVTRPEGTKEQFPAGCSEKRTGNLHLGEVYPDVILVYLGINDWGAGVAMESDAGDTGFALAYGLMLSRLKKNYPYAEIWCCTLGETAMESRPDFRFPEAFGGISIREYNHHIANAALAAGVCLADIHSQEIPFDTLDGTHPTAKGMDTLAMLMIRQMADEDGGSLLDCEMDHDIDKNICRRCGKPLPVPKENVLKLRLKQADRIVAASGWQVTLGRSLDNDLVLDNPYVDRSQATFTCREGKWRVRDNGTKNGTYLNGKRLEPDGEYRIHPGDTLCFAQKVEAEVLP
jgi:lysophospholipase L1-like esterase